MLELTDAEKKELDHILDERKQSYTRNKMLIRRQFHKQQNNEKNRMREYLKTLPKPFNGNPSAYSWIYSTRITQAVDPLEEKKREAEYDFWLLNHVQLDESRYISHPLDNGAVEIPWLQEVYEEGYAHYWVKFCELISEGIEKDQLIINSDRVLQFIMLDWSLPVLHNYFHESRYVTYHNLVLMRKKLKENKEEAENKQSWWQKLKNKNKEE